jgi:hypothetical protein
MDDRSIKQGLFGVGKPWEGVGERTRGRRVKMIEVLYIYVSN